MHEEIRCLFLPSAHTDRNNWNASFGPVLHHYHKTLCLLPLRQNWRNTRMCLWLRSICCLCHEAHFSSGLGEVKTSGRFTQSTQVSAYTAATDTSLQCLSQRYHWSGYSLFKLVIQTPAPPKDHNTIFILHPLLHVYRATYWSRNNTQWVCRDHRNINVAVSIALMKMNAGSRAFCNTHYPLLLSFPDPGRKTARSFSVPKITMCFHSHPLELCLWLCKWENMQEMSSERKFDSTWKRLLEGGCLIAYYWATKGCSIFVFTVGLCLDTPQLKVRRLQVNGAAYGLIILCSPWRCRMGSAVNGEPFHISSRAQQLVFMHLYYCCVPWTTYPSAPFAFVPQMNSKKMGSL